jgi:pimeloyl-ACP methyl ester carboxylesterase
MSASSTRFKTAKKWLARINVSRALRWVVYLLLAYWVYNNWHHDLPADEVIQQYTFKDARFIEVDGMNVHVRITGKGETMLLLHDANSSLHTWTGWTEKLSQKYQVISVDLPGFGLTGPHPRGSYSAFMYANFLEQLVQALKLKKFHLAGNGLGAQIAWFFAAESSERLQSLILIDAPGFEEKSNSWVNLMAKTPVLNRVMWEITPRAFVRLMLEDVYSDNQLVSDSLVDRHFKLLLYPGNRRAFTDRAQVSENRPPVDIIDNINIPTLILWGAEDTRISPEHAYEFHRRIRGAFLKIYQNTGHWPQEENPQQTVADVLAFLEGKF